MAKPAAKLEAEEEAELLIQIQSGSKAECAAAHERLFVALRHPIYALCLQLTGNAVDAEDALQECFISAFRGLSKFRGEARISTWLYRIAVREALRQKSRRSANQPRILSEPAAPEEANPAVRREEIEQLHGALAKLSAEHRTVLAMFAVQGLSHGEIAETLKIPTGTVWSRLHKARKQLAGQLNRSEHLGTPGSPPVAAKPVGRQPQSSAVSSPVTTLRNTLLRALRWALPGWSRDDTALGTL